MKPILYLVRGLPGSGKSSFARSICSEITHYIEADMYFTDESGAYRFDATKLSEAHSWCQWTTSSTLKKGHNAVVSNTSTTEREVEIYAKIAESCNAQFVSLIVENRHGSKSIHDVPEVSIKKMHDRFSIKL